MIYRTLIESGTDIKAIENGCFLFDDISITPKKATAVFDLGKLVAISLEEKNVLTLVVMSELDYAEGLFYDPKAPVTATFEEDQKGGILSFFNNWCELLNKAHQEEMENEKERGITLYPIGCDDHTTEQLINFTTVGDYSVSIDS